MELYKCFTVVAFMVLASCPFSTWSQPFPAPEVDPVLSAGLIGSEVRINCSIPGRTANQFIEVKWFDVSQPNVPLYIYTQYSIGGPVTKNYTQFTVDDSSPDTFDVIIGSLSRQTSTLYQFDTNLNSKPARVTGFDAMKCSESDQDLEVSEGTTVVLNCSVNYYEFPDTPPLIPKLQWYDSNGIIETQSDDVQSPNAVSKTANITLQADHDDIPLDCVVTYPDSTSAPIYNNSCSVTYFVRYPVSFVNASVLPDSEVFVNDVINCTSNGRPKPTYTWVNSDDTVVSDTFQLTVTEDMVTQDQPVTYTCRAIHNVDGTDFSKDFNLTVYAMSDGAPTLQSTGVEAWVIAVAVVVPVVVIAAAVIGGYFFYRHRKTKAAKKKKVPTATLR